MKKKTSYTLVECIHNGKYNQYRPLENSFMSLEEVDKCTTSYNDKQAFNNRYGIKSGRPLIIERVKGKSEEEDRTYYLTVILGKDKDLLDRDKLKFKFASYCSDNRFLSFLFHDRFIRATLFESEREYIHLREEQAKKLVDNDYPVTTPALDFAIAYTRSGYKFIRKLASLIVDYKDFYGLDKEKVETAKSSEEPKKSKSDQIDGQYSFFDNDEGNVYKL